MFILGFITGVFVVGIIVFILFCLIVGYDKYGISYTELVKINEYLAEENEKLKELNENYPIEEELAETYKREENYKSRIEKAVEYIKEMDTQLEVYGDYDILSDNKNDLLNILGGGK